MKIFVKAKPNSNCESVEKIDDSHFVVAVEEPPVQGRANQAVIRALAGYFKIPAYQISLIRGFKEKNKIFTLDMSSGRKELNLK